MTATALRTMTRQSVEAAPALEFPDTAPAASYTPAPYPQRAATVRLTYHGAPVELTLNNRKIAEVEQLVDSLLSREGWAVPAAAPAATVSAARAPNPAELMQEPFYNGKGEPCCPIHKRQLRESKFGGLYCEAKATGDVANDRGYCRYSWKDE